MSGGTGGTSTQKLSVYNYGAQSDAVLNANGTVTGGTDNTTAFNNYFNDCRLRGEEWFIPAGNWRVNGALSIFTGGKCEGNVLIPNNGTVKNRVAIRPLDEDLFSKGEAGALQLSTVKTWTGCTRRSRKINGLTGLRGRYITVNTVDQDLIKRGGNSWDLAEGFLVADDEGRLAHSLYVDWNTAAWTEAGTVLTMQTLRERISIEGLTVIVFDDGSGQPIASPPNPTETAVNVTRCNTDLVNCSVINKSNQQVLVGFGAGSVCNVTHESCYVEGLQVGQTNYGFQTSLSAGVNYVNCSEVYTRRGIDANKAKNISIVGGSFPDGVGAHYAWWMSVTGANLGGTNGVKTNTASQPNGSTVWVAGGGFTVENCTIYLSDLGTSVLGLRTDIFELGDSVIIRGNTIVFADRSGSAAILSAIGEQAGHNTGRAIEMPRLVVINDNNVTVYGTTRPVVAYEALDDSWSRATFPYDIVMSQRLEIKNNQWTFLSNANQPVPDAGSDGLSSRIRFTYYKPPMVVGSGIEADISGFPSLQMLLFAATQSDATIRASARFSGRIGQISGRLDIRRGPGAYRTVTYDVAEALIRNANSDVPNMPVVGDESINSVDLSRLVVDAEAVNGTSTVLQPNGPEANLDLQLKAKGSGLVRFGTRTGTGDAAINGYVSVKDAAGNLVKLATVA